MFTIIAENALPICVVASTIVAIDRDRDASEQWSDGEFEQAHERAPAGEAIKRT